MKGKLYAHLMETENAANNILKSVMLVAKVIGATEELKARVLTSLENCS